MEAALTWYKATSLTLNPNPHIIHLRVFPAGTSPASTAPSTLSANQIMNRVFETFFGLDAIRIATVA